MGIAIFCGILFLAYTGMNTGMTNTILPMVCEARGWEYSNILPFMSYGGYIGAISALFFVVLTTKEKMIGATDEDVLKMTDVRSGYE